MPRANFKNLLAAIIANVGVLSANSISAQEEKRTISVPRIYEKCAITPILSWGSPIFSKERLLAYPYDEKSPFVVFEIQDLASGDSAEKIAESCNGYAALSANPDVVYGYDEAYPLRKGYYAISDLFLLYSNFEAENGNIFRSYFYIATATELLLVSQKACGKTRLEYEVGYDFCRSDVFAEKSKEIERYLLGLDHRYGSLASESVNYLREEIETNLTEVKTR